ncbi:hypothetical protein CC86DRAFT_118718 [Ophiobolus disseminans]|uniref:Uncharacterized protein n=1 Tax=Ophiobolus disseminans TaxID=1469910 RepID=A0A6A6ZGK0_9PLEO|nr:hypothetical protein CC86DRAFT_118718 [Ophiobolus disseminans]
MLPPTQQHGVDIIRPEHAFLPRSPSRSQKPHLWVPLRTPRSHRCHKLRAQLWCDHIAPARGRPERRIATQNTNADAQYLPKAQKFVTDLDGNIYSLYTDFRPYDTVQAYQVGLSLFLACRQIHEEAASVFFSNNAFLITKKRVGASTKHDKLCNYAGRVLESWCTQIGKSTALLKHISLDLNCICRLQCLKDRESRGLLPQQTTEKSLHLDFTGFLGTVWTLKLRLDGTAVRVNLKDGYARLLYPNMDFKQTKMSQTIQCLCNDVLNITRCRHTLGRAAANEQGSGGKILYWTTTKHIHGRVDNDLEHQELDPAQHTWTDVSTKFFSNGEGTLQFGCDAATRTPLLPMPPSP